MKLQAAALNKLKQSSENLIGAFERPHLSVEIIRSALDIVRQSRASLLLVGGLEGLQGEEKIIILANQAIKAQKDAELIINHYFGNLTDLLGKKLPKYLEDLDSKYTVSIQDLIHKLTREDQNFFLDINLPLTWDFETDLFVTTSKNVTLCELMSKRGQKRSIIVGDCREESIYRSVSTKPDIFKALLDYGFTPPRQIFSLGFRDNEENHLKNFISTAVKSFNVYSNTSNRYSSLWIYNEIENSKEIFKSHCVTELKKIFLNKDVLVISPGPSLKNDLENIKNMKDQFISLAPLQSFPALDSIEIYPDYLLCIDPEDFTKHIDFTRISKCKGLIFAESIAPNVAGLKDVQKFVIFTSKQVLNLHDDIRGNLLNLFGASVSIIAADLSRELGARSITLIGQDLIIGDDNNYTGLPKEYNKTELLSDKVIWKGEEYDLKYLQAKNGKKYPTRPDFFNFHFEFEYFAQQVNKNIHLFNATSHGAEITGFKNCTLFEVPLYLSENSLKKEVTIKRLSKKDLLKRKEAVYKRVLQKKENIKDIEELANKALFFIDNKPKNLDAELNKVEHLLIEKVKGEWILSLYLKPFISVFSAQIKYANTYLEILEMTESLYHEVKSVAKILGEKFSSQLENFEV
jgi:hypothetical protein